MSEWLCEGNHPYYLIEGKKYCSVCEQIKLVGLSTFTCRRKHTRPAGDRDCSVRGKYRRRPWFRELDENGVATCPGGHTLNHATLSYSKLYGVWAQRSCAECLNANGAKANAVYVSNCEKRATEAGRKVRKRGEKKDTLAPEYIDWVVAYRLAMGKVDEVYDMKRGDHKGATAMEKWVAYCSTIGRDPSEFIRKSEGGERFIRPQWAEYGEQHKWKPKTLAQAMAE